MRENFVKRRKDVWDKSFDEPRWVDVEMSAVQLVDAPGVDWRKVVQAANDLGGLGVRKPYEGFLLDMLDTTIELRPAPWTVLRRSRQTAKRSSAGLFLWNISYRCCTPSSFRQSFDCHPALLRSANWRPAPMWAAMAAASNAPTTLNMNVSSASVASRPVWLSAR